MTTPETVRSADGTPIAFERRGEGAPVILIGGAFNDRTTVAGLAGVLADTHTAITYDRRGRGDSGDTPPYEVEREVEDVAALIDRFGGRASLFGHSSGAVLALEVAASGHALDKLVAYEPPFVVEGRARPGEDLVDRVRARIEAGDRDEAVRLFLVEGTGTPAEVVDGMATGPAWPWLTGLAHTLPYDLTICGQGNGLPDGMLAKIAVPTLVIGGGTSPEWMPASARAVAEAVPGARYETLEGQDHGVLQHPESLRSLLTEFLG